MDLDKLFEPLTKKQITNLSEVQIHSLVESQSRVIKDLYREVTLLKNHREDLKQKKFNLDEEYITVKYSATDRQVEEAESKQKQSKKPKRKKKKVQLPSERYPNAEIIDKVVAYDEDPTCECCSSKMKFSGMHEVSEQLTVLPAVFQVIRVKRQKYRCNSCHSNIVTVPNLPRIAPGSSYSDEMIIDVALSKYCDLIPIERYSSIAGRSGMIDLTSAKPDPVNSLFS